jgi:lysozyme family protein
MSPFGRTSGARAARICFLKARGRLADFKPAFEFMLPHEDAARSGKVMHDGDGKTRFGICSKFHRDLPEAFWSCDRDRALVWAQAIYRVEYWSAMRLGEIVDQAVASKLFDMCVPMGAKEATLCAQRAANALLLGSRKAPAIDGRMGSQTIEAINACPPDAIIEALCNLSKRFFTQVVEKNPAKAGDLKGWLRRAMDVPPSAAAKAATGAGA